MTQNSTPGQAPDAPAMLDDADPLIRARARQKEELRRAAVPPTDAPATGWVNLHAHSVYSFNAYGFTPTGLAWRARRAGLAAAGIVDFDVLDGVDEFLDAGRAFGIPAVAGIETRVFVPAFADRVINSPGEPGIAYHMGMGFPSSRIPEAQRPFLDNLRRTADARNRELVRRVNPALGPAALDYDADVLPLTPSGNATERHICLAYARKAARHFPARDALAAFWQHTLNEPNPVPDLPEGPGLINRIRARTMKRGGIGYIQPDRGAFPDLAEMNRFIQACGAVPVIAWLDGSSEGEQAPEELLDVFQSAGCAAANIIPDRNFTPGKKDAKLDNLNRFAAACRARQLPLLAGTEMNAPGNRFVDRFDAAELAPLLPDFLRGSHVFFAHTVLQAQYGLGVTSDWARASFASASDRNAFYADIGSRLPANANQRLHPVPPVPVTPDSLRRTVSRIFTPSPGKPS